MTVDSKKKSNFVKSKRISVNKYFKIIYLC